MKSYCLLYILLFSLIFGVMGCTDSPQRPTDPGTDLEITSIEPDEGPVGITVTISGTGFSPTAAQNNVTFSDTDADIIEASENELKAEVPKGAETGPVEVTVDGESTDGPTFTVNNNQPAIQSVEPDSGNVGTEIMITGQNFGDDPDQTELLFSETPATIHSITDTEIITEVPEGAETGQIQLTVGEETTTGPEFKVYVDPPSIESINPTMGTPGTQVTIAGENFGDDPDDVEIFFSDADAPVLEISDTELITEVPTDAESGPIRVTVADQSATGPDFTVQEEADSFTAQGVVVDEATGQGVEGVEISFSDGSDPVQTDSDGSWSANGLHGPVAVSVQSDSWDFPIETRLVLGESDDVDFNAYTNYDAPSGTRIAYQFREDCSSGTACDVPYDIWTMASNGLNKEQLTDSTGSDHNPTWSPDATQIAFDSDRGDTDENRIYIIDADSSALTDTGVEGTQPKWSPDGERIVYINDSNIYVMDLNGNTEQIYNSGGNWASSPTWSPDGSKIAFTLNEGGTSDTHIWVMEDNGSRATRLTNDNAPNREPAWKPTGNAILYASNQDAVNRLRLITVDGSEEYTEDWPDHAQRQPAWSPGSGGVLYVNRRMIPISDRIRRIPATSFEWSEVAPGSSDAEPQYWATSPEWAPQ